MKHYLLEDYQKKNAWKSQHMQFNFICNSISRIAQWLSELFPISVALFHAPFAQHTLTWPKVT